MSNNELPGNYNTAITNENDKQPFEEVSSFEEHIKKSLEIRQKKTVEEKAKEKRYYKAEDGTWWEAFDDGFDEKVEWFKLDEEYPDLADKTEELAEKYNVRYDDYSGLKKYVYQKADTLKDASNKHLTNIFRVAGAITHSTGGTEELLVGYDPDKLEAICDSLNSFYSRVADLMPEHKLDRRIMEIGECLVRNYNEKLVEGDFIESLAKYSAKAFSDKSKEHKITQGLESGIQGISKNEDSGRLFDDSMNYYDELVESDDKITKYDTKSAVLSRYVRNHGVEPSTIKGFKDIVFPLMEQKDNEVLPIIEGGNAYGTTIGTYGVADYTEECLLSSYNPGEINRLIRIYHEIPTSDYKKFEQNRKDAARLQGTIIGGRDFIHDERPGTNEMLVAIKNYYEHRDSDDSANYKFRLAELEDKYHFGVLPNAFNIEAYEKPIEYMSDHNRAEKGNKDETALDILNRLIENTRPNLLEAPKTKNEELNKLMESISPTINERTGEVLVDFDKVGTAVAKMNEILLQNKGKQGIYPSTVSAIAFLDKMSAHALRNVSTKDLQELPFDPKFKGIVRFSQLTSNIEYNENDFENKYRQIINRFNEAYGDDGVDLPKIVEGYQILSQQILKNMQGLSRIYASKPTTARFSEAVWSGNLSDELIGLFDKV